jgi:hypothetical protein
MHYQRGRPIAGHPIAGHRALSTGRLSRRGLRCVSPAVAPACHLSIKYIQVPIVYPFVICPDTATPWHVI